MSGDGTAVAFGSDADNLVGEGDDTNGQPDVYVVRDGEDQPALVPGSDAGGPATEASQAPALSGDARFVAFEQVTPTSQGDPPADPAVVVSGPTLLVTGMQHTSAPTTGGGQLVIEGAGFGAHPVVSFGTQPSPEVALESASRSSRSCRPPTSLARLTWS